MIPQSEKDQLHAFSLLDADNAFLYAHTQILLRSVDMFWRSVSDLEALRTFENNLAIVRSHFQKEQLDRISAKSNTSSMKEEVDSLKAKLRR